MQTFLKDLRYGWRMLLNKPGFALVAVITLALGIGANTAIFSVVNAVLLQPLPYAQPERLVRVYTEFPTMDLRKFWMSPPEYMDIRNEAQSWENIGAWSSNGVNIATTKGEPIRVTSALVTRSLIDALGVQPALGRNFSEEEDIKGGPRTALIADGLWRSAFGSDPNIVGREIQINAQPTTVIGVMPRTFNFPAGSNDPAQVWLPLQFDPANPGGRGNHFLYIVGRLKPGVTLEAARAEMDSLMAGWRDQNRSRHLLNPNGHPVLMIPLHEDVVGAARPAVLMLLGAVAFVLLIACVNVANLLLARAEARRREFAIRLAMGAGRGRLLRQFLAEGFILVMLGAIAGLVLGKLGLSLVIAAAPDSVPRTGDISINLPVLAFTLGLSVLSVIIFALAPLVQMRERDLATWLHGSGKGTAGSGGQTLRKTLVIAEIALAVVPMIGSGLMVRAFWKLRAVDLGFEPRGVIAFNLALPRSRYQNPELLRFSETLESKLAAIPGVQSAAEAGELPPIRPIDANDTQIEGFQQTPDGPAQNVDFWNIVGKDYLKTMGIRTISGRTFEPMDMADNALKVVIINQAMARRFWPDQDPIGRRINPQVSQEPNWFTVIGVVEDTKNLGTDKPAGTEIYILEHQTVAFGISSVKSFVVRTGSTPGATMSNIRAAVAEMDPSIPIYGMKTMSEVVGDALVKPRFLSLLLGAFSMIAITLAAIGIYGVMAYSVTQRTQEIGVRVALGATTGNVLAMIMGQGLKMTVIGLATGLTGAFFLTQVMASLLFEVSPTDPLTFVVVGIGLTAIGLLACLVPARRAARVDPMVALRYE
ncbi:MAG TPA: ABC transporter permease [Blastocatellia bacterium]|nr:ABC transporter permease [Blastocatellia bacterium]